MNKQILVFVTLLILTSCRQSYQMRTIYYSEVQNVCYPRYGERVPTTFVFSQQLTLTQNLWVGIECGSSLLPFYWDIQTSGVFTTQIQGEQIDFGVDMKKRTHGLQRQIVTNITLSTKQFAFRGFDYECQLMGDGQVQHYNVQNSPITSTLTIACEKKYGKKIEVI